MLLREITATGLLYILFGFSPWAQEKGSIREITNPLGSDKAAIAAGREQYEAACGGCHGITGKGGRGPRLAGIARVRNMPDKMMFETIKEGVKGTPMPPFSLSEPQIWQLVSFIRNLNATAIDQQVAGDGARGEAFFFGTGKCSGCHMIRGRGGLLGPDLSNLGSTRSVEAIEESLKSPNALIEPGYAGVSVVTLEGQRVSGVLRNESNYSIQILDGAGNFHLFSKRELKELVRRRKSLMPTPSLSERDLQDVLAFLSRQSIEIPAQESRKSLHEKWVEP
jgi:cytochrome c oxidase cbb3-type subunit 3